MSNPADTTLNCLALLLKDHKNVVKVEVSNDVTHLAVGAFRFKADAIKVKGITEFKDGDELHGELVDKTLQLTTVAKDVAVKDTAEG